MHEAYEVSSPYNDLIGIRTVAFEPGRVVVELQLAPHHLNRSGWVHGGVIMTLLDIAATRSGCWAGEGQIPLRSQTISLTTNFLQAARGGLLRATGTLRQKGKSIYNATAEVVGEDGALLAIAQGSFKYRVTSKPIEAPSA